MEGVDPKVIGQGSNPRGRYGDEHVYRHKSYKSPRFREQEAIANRIHMLTPAITQSASHVDRWQTVYQCELLTTWWLVLGGTVAREFMALLIRVIKVAGT